METTDELARVARAIRDRIDAGEEVVEVSETRRLREAGYSVVETMFVLAKSFGMNLSDAKQLVVRFAASRGEDVDMLSSLTTDVIDLGFHSQRRTPSAEDPQGPGHRRDLAGDIQIQFGLWPPHRDQRLLMGDALDSPRSVEHFAIFPHGMQIDSDISDLEKRGFSVRVERAALEITVQFRRNEILNDDNVLTFLGEVMPIIELAGGIYLGWECTTLVWIVEDEPGLDV